MGPKDRLDKTIAENAREMLDYGFLAIDPSSGSENSQPGYALFVRGRKVKSGTFTINHKLPIHQRLEALYCHVKALVTENPVVLLSVERIRGRMAHEYLRWAVGVCQAAGGQKVKATVEIPIQAWKPVAKATDDYVKGDESDAVAMGTLLLLKAQSYVQNGTTDLGLLSGNATSSTGRTATKRRSTVERKRRPSARRSGRNRKV